MKALVLEEYNKLVFKEIRPYQKADFADPAVAKDLNRIFKNVDLGDPEVHAALREIRIPTRVVEEVQRVGRAAYSSAPCVLSPTLLVQGTHDTLVPPVKTKRLLGRLQGPKRYIEVAAGHDLLDPGGPAWTKVKTAVLEFVLENPVGEGQ